MITLWNLLRNKVVQLIGLLGIILIAYSKMRRDITSEAKEEVINTMERADEIRANDIRKRVADVPDRMLPDPSDSRGYRD